MGEFKMTSENSQSPAHKGLGYALTADCVAHKGLGYAWIADCVAHKFRLDYALIARRCLGDVGRCSRDACNPLAFKIESRFADCVDTDGMKRDIR